MAITLEKAKLTVDMGSIVNNSIEAVRSVRRSNQARKEAEFQRAIANGLSYEEVIKIREKQLEEERGSSFSDSEYIEKLSVSIADTKKLNRFNKYRTKYVTSFSDLVAGRVNEQRYLDVLKDQLVGVSDPELTLEIQKNIASAEEGLKAYNDIILSNKVKFAKNNGTVKTLASMVSQVTIARSNASINNNEDEVTAYDETLAALNSQLSNVKIEDAMLDFQVKSETRGTNALEKLDFMNEQIRSADSDSPIRVPDGSGGVRTYSSAQAFWSVTRDNYLASSFFKELDINIKNNVAANTKASGISQVVLDNVMKTFNDLKAKPELAPFISQLGASQNVTMNDLVGKFANRWIEASGVTGNFAQASQQIAAVGNRYGVDTVSYVETLAGKAASLVEGGEKEVVEEQPPFKGEVIEEAPAPVPVTTPVPTPASAPKPVSAPAPKPEPTPTPTPVPVAESPQFTPATGVGTKSTDGAFTFTKEGWKPTASIPISTPVATPVPVTPTTPSSYLGQSVVGYLKFQKQDSSFASRAKLATEKGITGYTGTAKQNTDLLKLLRG